VVMVVMGGGPLDISAAKASAGVGAIIWCGYPGQSGGTSIADAIFGKTNVWGKLSLTWYNEDFAKKVNAEDMGMRPNAKTGNPGRTYRFYTGTPVYKFGEGLRYSTFNSAMDITKKTTDDVFALVDKESRMSLTHFTSTTVATATVNVANTGDMDGDEIVLLFGAPPAGVAGVNGNPIQQLVAYERVSVRAGETKSVNLDITTKALKLADKMGVGFTVKGEWRFWLGVKSADSTVTTLAL